MLLTTFLLTTTITKTIGHYYYFVDVIKRAINRLMKSFQNKFLISFFDVESLF